MFNKSIGFSVRNLNFVCITTICYYYYFFFFFVRCPRCTLFEVVKNVLAIRNLCFVEYLKGAEYWKRAVYSIDLVDVLLGAMGEFTSDG